MTPTDTKKDTTTKENMLKNSFNSERLNTVTDNNEIDSITYDLIIHTVTLLLSNLNSDLFDQAFYKKICNSGKDMKKVGAPLYNVPNSANAKKETKTNLKTLLLDTIYKKLNGSYTLKQDTEIDELNFPSISPYIIKKRLQNFLKHLLKTSIGKKQKHSEEIKESILNILEPKNIHILLYEPININNSKFTIYTEIRKLFFNFLRRTSTVRNKTTPVNHQPTDYRFDLSKIVNRVDYSNRFIFYGQIILEFFENQNVKNVFANISNCPVHIFIYNIIQKEILANCPKGISGNSKKVPETSSSCKSFPISKINQILYPSFYIYGDSGCNCSYKIVESNFLYVDESLESINNNIKPLKGQKTHNPSVSTTQLIKQACYLLEIQLHIEQKSVFFGETRNCLNGAYYYNYLYGKKIWDVEDPKTIEMWAKGNYPKSYTNILYKPVRSVGCVPEVPYINRPWVAKVNNTKKHLSRKEESKISVPVSTTNNESLNTESNIFSGSNLYNSVGSIDQQYNSASIKKYFKKKIHVKCMNCSTSETSLWRKHFDKNICNSCGLYYRLHGKHRTISSKKNIIRRRRRIDGVLQPSKASKNVRNRVNPFESKDEK
ncbi:GATA-type transcription factor sreA [Cucumispora dikerogammari]|nr:GATA-type transcription factor sreA [Cucumispora dikerogammari]